MWAKRLAREPTTVARVRVALVPSTRLLRWSWALVVVAPEVRHYADAVDRVGRVLPFDWPPAGPQPSVRDAVRELLRQRPVPT
jgi:hypothetical protein